MYQPHLLHADDPALTAARSRVASTLRTAVAALPPSSRGADPELAGIAAWSAAHGFATLVLSGSLDPSIGDRDPAEVFRSFTGLMFRPGHDAPDTE